MYCKTSAIRDLEVMEKMYSFQENIMKYTQNLVIIEDQQMLFVEIGMKIGSLEKLVIISRDKCFISRGLREALETDDKIKLRNQNSSVTNYVVHPSNFNEDLLVKMKMSQKIMNKSTASPSRSQAKNNPRPAAA
mmetsp:Transcript_40896/g.46950  ORF Transcript_40896/g.46950 Transcript_40896/m.46950 type:complete len:134 (+) Transcript_40896:205-606(+)